MTEDVLSYGDERPPRTSRGRPLLAVAVVAALVASGVSYARHREPHRKAAQDRPPVPIDSPFPFPEPTFDPFADAVAVPIPTRRVTGLVLPGGVPGFVVARAADGSGPYDVVEAVGGPQWAPVLVGWCAPRHRFEDATGAWTYAFSEDGLGYLGLHKHQVRVDTHDATHLDVAREWGDVIAIQVTTSPSRGTPCPAPLAYPPLPARSSDVHATRGAYLVIRGRYVVTTETVAFCAARKPAGCLDQGWERYGLGGTDTVPIGDLAGSYTWEGDFLVQANSSDGTLSAVRLPGARLTKREHVGVALRVGLPHGTYWRGGLLHLRLNPLADIDPNAPDDSPPGTPERNGLTPDPGRDVRGGLRDYVVRPDAQVILGEGITGLGLPKATPATLRKFVLSHPNTLLWVVLDSRGRALRVIADQPHVVVPQVDPAPPY